MLSSVSGPGEKVTTHEVSQNELVASGKSNQDGEVEISPKAVAGLVVSADGKEVAFVS